MFNSIRFKLFSIFLAISLVVVAGMYVVLHWSFNHGFSELIQSRQQERVKNLLDGLIEYYGSNQSLETLRNDKDKWLDLLLESDPRKHQPEWSKLTYDIPPGFWPPDVPEEQTRRRFTPFELRVMLLNADKQIIRGRQELLTELDYHPILYQEQTIGYLGLLPGKMLNHVSEIRFLEKQSEALIWMALAMIVMSFFLALSLAYFLGKPLKRVTGAVKMLATGKYDLRLPVESADELGQLARDFNDLAAALSQAEESRRRWMADISHEFRTPLAILRCELEAIQDGIRPRSAESIDSLLLDVMRLHRLTEDLYQLSLSDQGALTYRKEIINPEEVLLEDLDAMRPLFNNKGITVEVLNEASTPLKIYADADRLSQLFKNVLTNSLNYTDAPGKLRISVNRDGENIWFDFSDSPPGVAEAELPKLFERFYRVDSSRNSGNGGAGLGLAICKNIAQAHQGEIGIHASELKGVSILIKLPLSL